MKRYHSLSIFFHWLLAIMIIGAFIMGTIMVDMRISPTKLQFYNWHKWAGVTILALVAMRLLTRLFKPAPNYPDSMKNWEKQAAHATHIFLYVLMFSVPISGYLYTFAAGYPVVYFAWLELPAVVGPFPEYKDFFKETHDILTKVMFITVMLHVAAAMKHLVINKDGVFQRILPSFSKNK